MKKILYIFIVGLLTAVSLTSCDNPVYPTEEDKDGVGTFSCASLSLEVFSSDITIENRSGIDVSTFIVNIRDKNTLTLKHTWKYSEMPEIITLPVGDYVVECYNEEVKDTAWDAPYYYASKEFAITNGNITEIGNLICKLSNVKVTIAYSDELIAAIGSGDDVKVNVLVGNVETLDFAYGETRSGYFRFVPESTTLVATFTGTIDGYYMSDFKVLSDVAAGQHRIITFGLKEIPEPGAEYGSIGLTNLALDAKVTKIDLTVNVPANEEEIDPDDMLQISSNSISYTATGGSKAVTVNSTSNWTVTSNQSWCTTSVAAGAKGTTQLNVEATENTATEERQATLTFTMGNISQDVVVRQAAKGDDTAPTITSETLDLENVNEITDGMTAVVIIKAPKGITHLNVKIDSPTLTPSDLEDVGLAGEFDLANPGSIESGLKGLGFPTGEDVVGKTEILFDISQFMGLLGTFKSEHNFILKVTDTDNQTAEATLKFIAR
ncbi:MAG: DUF4493 domain-containing protein [Muribaculaceae bacterium]|nr:DUF4493 domain-containing protein [Muribaculaceae bacterium]